MKVTLKKSKRSEKGFTLLEVLIALAIISISLVVLLQTQSSNILRSYHSASLTKAAILGQKIMSDIDSESSLSVGEWDGEEIIEEATFKWNKNVEASVVSKMLKVTVTVSWGNEESGLPYIIETYRAI